MMSHACGVGERVPNDAPVVLVVGNSNIGSSEEEEEFGDLWGEEEIEDDVDVEDGFEEEL